MDDRILALMDIMVARLHSSMLIRLFIVCAPISICGIGSTSCFHFSRTTADTQKSTHRLAQYAAHTQRTKDLEADRATFLRHEAVDVANERRDRDQMNVRISRSFSFAGCFAVEHNSVSQIILKVFLLLRHRLLVSVAILSEHHTY